MGLSALLMVGKSLRAAGNVPNRYRMSRRAALPVFEAAPRTPMRMETMKTVTSERQSKAAVADRTATKEATPSGGSPSAQGPSEAPRGARQAERPWWHPAGWFSGKGKWLGKAGRSRPSGGRPGRLIQQELTLEQITPCRNDLRDADWELARPAAGVARLAFLRNLTGGGAAAPQKARPPVRGQAAGHS